MKKLLIVGAFPKNTSIHGGQVTVCKKLIESNVFSKYNLVLIDSTQKKQPLPSVWNRFLYSIKKLIHYNFHLLSSKIDVILIFSAAGTSLIEKSLMVYIASIAKKPVLIFPRSGLIINEFENNIIYRFFLKYCITKANYFLCQGSSMQKFATDKLHFAKENAPIVPNWTATLNLLEFKPKEKDFDIVVKTIVFVGWLEKFKGVYELLDALFKISYNKIDYKFIFIGDGNEREKLQEITNNNKHNEKIKFYGWKKTKEIIDILSQSHIFILPSWSEGFPNSVIEAMCTTNAVITTNVGTIPDFLTSGKDSLLISPKNSDEIYEALFLLLNNNNLVRDIAINGYETAKNTFSTEKSLNLLLKCVNNALLSTKKNYIL